MFRLRLNAYAVITLASLALFWMQPVAAADQSLQIRLVTHDLALKSCA